MRIACYQLIGTPEDAASGPAVLLELDYRQIGIIYLQPRGYLLLDPAMHKWTGRRYPRRSGARRRQQ